MTSAVPTTAAAVVPAAAPARRTRLRRPAHEPDPVGGLPPQWAAFPIDPSPRRATGRGVRLAGHDVLPHDAVAPAVGGPDAAVRPHDSPRPSGMVRPGRASERGPSGGTEATTVELHRLAADMVRRMVEVLAGRRSPMHLTGAARPQVVRYLAASRDTGRGAGQATPPRRVHVARPTPDAAEVVAVCRFGERFRALTVRLDRVAPDRSWRASAVRLL